MRDDGMAGSSGRNSGLPDENGVYFDPVWRVAVELTELERELLARTPMRRLAFVAHAGAASLLSPQTYSRLEHSLGLLALVSVFRPDDTTMRAAALLHDIGHPPLSHTLEAAIGVDHHRIGERRVLELEPVLRTHGVAVEDVIASVRGEGPSALSGARGALKLDHLESFVRSAHAHGRTRHAPRQTLDALRLVDGAVHCDAGTARDLVRLVIEEAERQTSPRNALLTAVARDLTSRALAAPSAPDAETLASMTDGEFWSHLDGIPEIGRDARRLRLHPEHWSCEILADGAEPDEGTLPYAVARLYLDLPVVDGVRWSPSAEEAARMHALPTRFAVRPHDPVEVAR